MAKHNNGKSKKHHVEYDEIWIYKKCFKCDEEEVEGNEERTSSSHVLKQSKHKYIVELLHMNGLEGLQEQGEVFYIPTGWFYAYINIGETLVLRNTVGNVLSWYNMDNTNKMLQHKCKLPCTIERNDEVAGKDEEN